MTTKGQQPTEGTRYEDPKLGVVFEYSGPPEGLPNFVPFVRGEIGKLLAQAAGMLPPNVNATNITPEMRASVVKKLMNPKGIAHQLMAQRDITVSQLEETMAAA